MLICIHEINMGHGKIVMPQLDRKPDAYWKKVHERIECSRALEVAIAYAHGDDSISSNRARMALDLVKMTVPQLQAIAISNSEAKPASLGDIQAMLTVAGLDADSILSKPSDSTVIEHTVSEEKTVIDQEVIETPHTRHERE